MPDIKNTTRAQTRFLRMLRQSADNFPAEDWPSPLVLRRWIKNEDFYEHLKEVLDALYLQSDILLARATFRAANDLPAMLYSHDCHRGLLATIRLNHYHRNSVRRTTKPESPFPPPNPEAFARLIAIRAEKSDRPQLPDKTNTSSEIKEAS